MISCTYLMHKFKTKINILKLNEFESKENAFEKLWRMYEKEYFNMWGAPK